MKQNIFISTLILFFFANIIACDSNPDKSKTKSLSAQKDLPTNLSKDSPLTPKTEESNFVYGVDISRFQKNEIDFLDKKKDNLAFVICKATEGITYTDPDFKNNWDMIAKKNFIRGAYHFYRSEDDPSSQAATFFRAISDLENTDLPPIVDFEGGGINKSQAVDFVQKNLLIFLKEIEKKLNRKPMIYTDISIGNKYLNHSDFSKYALWVAVYNNKKKPELPNAWKQEGWRFWQKTSSYELDNQKNDFDVFNGSSTNLTDFIKNY